MKREKRKMCKEDAQAAINDYLKQSWEKLSIIGLHPFTIENIVWVSATIQKEFTGEDSYNFSGKGKVILIREKEVGDKTEELVTISGNAQIGSNNEKEPIVEKIENQVVMKVIRAF